MGQGKARHRKYKKHLTAVKLTSILVTKLPLLLYCSWMNFLQHSKCCMLKKNVWRLDRASLYHQIPESMKHKIILRIQYEPSAEAVLNVCLNSHWSTILSLTYTNHFKKFLELFLCLEIYSTTSIYGACNSVVVETLRYKQDGHGFEIRWGEWFLSIYLNLSATLGPEVYSPSTWNEYQNLKKYLRSRARPVLEVTTSLPSVSRLSSPCGILNTSQPYRPLRSVTEMALRYFCIYWHTISYRIFPVGSDTFFYMFITFWKHCWKPFFDLAVSALGAHYSSFKNTFSYGSGSKSGKYCGCSKATTLFLARHFLTTNNRCVGAL
jgi:hypothetical protein